MKKLHALLIVCLALCLIVSCSPNAGSGSGPREATEQEKAIIVIGMDGTFSAVEELCEAGDVEALAFRAKMEAEKNCSFSATDYSFEKNYATGYGTPIKRGEKITFSYSIEGGFGTISATFNFASVGAHTVVISAPLDSETPKCVVDGVEVLFPDFPA